MKKILILLLLFLLCGCKEKITVLRIDDTEIAVETSDVYSLREKGFEIIEHDNMDKRTKLYLDEVFFNGGRVSLEIANLENTMMSFEKNKLISIRIYPADYDEIYLDDILLTDRIDENCETFKGKMNNMGCVFKINNCTVSLNRNPADKDKNYLDNILIENK